MFQLIIKHLLFFLVGILQDFLITSYYQAIAKERSWHASALSTSITLVNLVILYEILSGIQNQILTIILAYAIGNGVGTMIVMKKGQIRKYLSGKMGCPYAKE